MDLFPLLGNYCVDSIQVNSTNSSRTYWPPNSFFSVCVGELFQFTFGLEVYLTWLRCASIINLENVVTWAVIACPSSSCPLSCACSHKDWVQWIEAWMRWVRFLFLYVSSDLCFRTGRGNDLWDCRHLLSGDLASWFCSTTNCLCIVTVTLMREWCFDIFGISFAWSQPPQKNPSWSLTDDNHWIHW